MLIQTSPLLVWLAGNMHSCKCDHSHTCLHTSYTHTHTHTWDLQDQQSEIHTKMTNNVIIIKRGLFSLQVAPQIPKKHQFPLVTKIINVEKKYWKCATCVLVFDPVPDGQTYPTPLCLHQSEKTG